MTTSVQAKHDVGGVLLDRPFKIRRLGHFGFNVGDASMEACRHFYVDLLGFRISDEAGFARRLPEDQLAGLRHPTGYFTRHNTDHHTFVLFNRDVMERLAQLSGRRVTPGITINQITWQVGSLAEVGNGARWFAEQGVPIARTGRDMPGSNWHTYVSDPDGHTNELYYGIEQVGWEGYSKPRALYHRGFQTAPDLPQMSEFDEVQQAMADGVDLHAGYRHVDSLPATHDVDGILLPRPFKVVRIGPVSLFVADVDVATAFYRDRLGFTVTEAVEWQGARCTFLRANTEHHALALFPAELRAGLGFSAHTTGAAFGLQVATYRQLRAAVRFLTDHGCRLLDTVPPDLHPGIDYAAHVLDPDGHCIQLYYAMEQIGWDGRPRPRDQRRVADADPATWPETVAALPDTFAGEPFLGPWG
jgi:catechol 2,3-dioxygenase-like lactoylglutathione lyase family enzyme